MLSQLFSTIRKATGWLASVAIRGITMLGNGLKSLVVNSMPIDAFLVVAKYLPIGGWLEHERPNEFGINSVYTALREENKEKLRAILKTASPSEKAIHNYLLAENLISHSSMEKALFISKHNPSFLKILISAVKPEKRLWLLQKVRWLGKPFIFGLVKKNEKAISYVMEALPEQDRFKFMDILDEAGNTPAMVQLRTAVSSLEIRAFLKHCPPTQVFSYLTKLNKRGQTALMCLLAMSPKFDVDDSFEYVLNLIPKERRKEFLAFHNQGEKLMLRAHADGRKEVKALLRKNGIKMPKLEKTNGNNTSKALTEEWEAKEKFKEMFGAYPLVVLGLEDKYCTEGEIKKAYHIKMLKYHPDRNQKESAKEKAQKTASAYEFYTKPEARKKYLARC